MRKPTVDEHSAAQSSSLPVNFPPGVDLEIRKNRFLARRHLGFLHNHATLFHVRSHWRKRSASHHPSRLGVALVWQITFAIIARDPVRFRTIMIPAVLEKLVYSIPVIVLVLQRRTRPADLLFAAIDLSLGVLFVIAYLRTPHSVPSK